MNVKSIFIVWAHHSRRAETLATDGGWTELYGSLKRKKWVVYAKRPFSSPETVLEYLGRYTHRVAISNHRIQSVDDGKVTFLYRGRKDDTSRRSMTLDADEFIRRFLLHVLPTGFHRIRYYGFLGARHRREKLARCRQLLSSPASAPTPSPPTAAPNYRDRVEALTAISLYACPACHRGEMIIIERLLPASHAGFLNPDTS